ncbi:MULTISPECIES: hypothetical protein [Clostridia]|uniref:hypothetical protein n=1 Tax=Clostridia TaxID=186801 RepID=UPI000EA36C7E|nr:MULTISPECIES: hypothetical protein [Clostridia]NBJ71633.1 hypothetical protein [Roseburia sp. 1XD42-34]RKI73930.1 hypothetical protein D7V87_19760 [Clostridium sp. 1xD42-85]
MDRLTRFNVDFFNLDSTPYHQVSSNFRLRVLSDTFHKKNELLLRELIFLIFNKESRIDSTFISGYIVNGKRRREKVGLGKIFKLKNWKEIIVKDEVFEEEEVIFATVKELDRYNIYKYCMKVTSGYMNSAYIIFYNDSFMLYLSSDVLDVISYNDKLINDLKLKLPKEIIDQHHDN